MPKHLYRSGFSLIELMVVVAIIGILSAVAIPSYSSYVVRSKIPEATSALAVMRTQLEQYYQDNRDFGATATACGIAVPVLQNFSVTCNWGDGASLQSYRITATGIAGRGTASIAYTIDHQGKRKTITLPAGWMGEGKACWVNNKDGAC